jgi:molybdopterin synthase catalytic subunit
MEAGVKMPEEAVRVQAEDFSVEDEIRRLRASSKRIGAVVTFLGTARDFSEGKQIKAVEFEQYSGMALKALEDLRTDALKRFDIIDVRIVHRINRIEPGGQIVLIAVASEHRKEAFEACRWAIDTLKKTVPIWKKELTPEGESWVTPHP